MFCDSQCSVGLLNSAVGRSAVCDSSICVSLAPKTSRNQNPNKAIEFKIAAIALRECPLGPLDLG